MVCDPMGGPTKSMKVTGNLPGGSAGATDSTQRTQEGQRSQQPAAPSATETRSSDQTSTARRSELLSRAAETNAAERQQRLEHLREQVRSGRYHADAHEVSRGIIREALAESGTLKPSHET
jgi:anti-sigma28 factor (negative regulator of flagellin synthesis)